MSITRMKGYSVFMRKGRAFYYITALSAQTGRWRQEATQFRIADPQGFKKAARLAEQIAQQYFRSRSGSHHEAWAAWVRPYLQRRYSSSPKTLLRYTQAWDNVHPFLVSQNVTRPAQLAYTHALDYLEWRTAQVRNNGKHITRNCAIFEIKLLSTIMIEAVRRGFALANTVEKLGIPRDPPKEKRELTADDIAKIRAWANQKEGHLPITDRWMTICFEIALHQGCRHLETSVPMTDVDEEKGNITFRGKGRDGRPRIFTTSLHPALVPMMRELRAAGAARTCHLPKMAGKLWFFGFQDAGVQGASFHCTRVTVITRMARAGVPIQQAMRFVNHSSRVVHAIYQKLKPEDLSACTAVLNFEPVRQAQGGPKPATPTQSPGGRPAMP